jgi:hypothetical protein
MSNPTVLPFKVIGLNGLAGSGKDLFFNLLQKELPRVTVTRFALADILKDELFHHVYSLYRIDLYRCTREEKNLVRPMMVAHGKVRRSMTNGKYWTDKLTESINNHFKLSPNSIACVTDVRYDIYPEDEVFWLKEKMHGKLVHISLYEEDDDGERVFVQPPNSDEAENDPKIRSQADYRVVWPKLIGPKNLSPDWSHLSKYAKDCINALKG